VDFGGRLHALPASPGALIGTRLLSFAGKLRLLAEPLRRATGPRDETVRDFFARRLGPEVAERLVAPFVSGIFAGDAAALSAEAAFPSLARWDREHGSLLAGAIREARARPKPPPRRRLRGLLSFRDGLTTLPRALARSLGGAFHPSTAVTSVSPAGSAFRVGGSHGEMEAQEVILAAPAAEAATLVRGFAPDAAAALEAIPHPPLAVLHLAVSTAALRRPLVGFGHLVVPDPSRRILGAVWSSSLFPGRAPEGRALLTVFLGGARDPQAVEIADDALLDVAARDLEAEGLLSGRPELVMLTRWARSIPQYTAGHLARIDALARAEAQWPGLRFVGNYRGGISVGDVVKSALTAGG
jgi:oxygen-dependent protoporphyrinogen oxidase